MIDNSSEMRRMPHNTPSCTYPANIIRTNLVSGESSREAMRFMSRRHMLELLDHWNCDSRWKYHSTVL